MRLPAAADRATAAAARRASIARLLYAQVLAAILLGIVVGHFWPAQGAALKPLGDGFIKLVKMVISPVIFLTIVTGIAGMRELRSVGRVAAVQDHHGRADEGRIWHADAAAIDDPGDAARRFRRDVHALLHADPFGDSLRAFEEAHVDLTALVLQAAIVLDALDVAILRLR